MPAAPLQFATQLARETGDLLLKYFNQPGLQVSLKPDQTIVTEADLAANQHIQAAIQAAFPEDDILSEEANTHFQSTQTPTWVIDPVDGTTNFAAGFQHWGISISRLVEGRPALGVVFFPVLNELYHATRGGGAYLNNQPIHVQPGISDMTHALFMRDNRMYEFFTGRMGIKSRILGAATYNFCAVARGIAIAGFESTPKIWDLAAAWLILQEAGGKHFFYRGELFPAVPGMDYGQLNCPVLFGANEEIVDKGKIAIQPRYS